MNRRRLRPVGILTAQRSIATPYEDRPGAAIAQGATLFPMAVIPDANYGVGPPDGDVLQAGLQRWSPRPPHRPGMPGQRLLTFTFAGQGLYTCDGVELVVRRGDMVVMYDDSPTAHGVPAGPPWEYYYLLFNPPGRLTLPPVFDRVARGLYRAHVALESTRQRVQDAFARAAADLGRRDTARALNELGDGPPLFRSGPEDEPQRRLLLTIVEEILLLAIQDRPGDATFDPRISLALEAMGTNPIGPHTVGSLAEMVHMSPSRFAHLFTTEVGLSPMRTLRLIRLQHAARLLQCTSQPIGVVATASGFSTIFDFSRQFRQHRGISPSDYRAEWRS
jgi:AraC family transcriptional regulator, arabinose operon regulatory protein